MTGRKKQQLMKSRSNLAPAFAASLAALFIGAGTATVAAAQAPTPKQSPAMPSAVKPQVTGDYLVKVGDHVMWKSQVGKMHLVAASPAKSTGTKAGKGDYPVQVGKHTMLKSQVEKMHPELVRKAAPLSKQAGTDYPVQMGKTTVMASTLRRVDAPTRPTPHNAACTDYRVQSGKQTVWASSIGAPCPAGVHKGEMKPLCCTMVQETGKKLMPCCKVAQGK